MNNNKKFRIVNNNCFDPIIQLNNFKSIIICFFVHKILMSYSQHIIEDTNFFKNCSRFEWYGQLQRIKPSNQQIQFEFEDFSIEFKQVINGNEHHVYIEEPKDQIKAILIYFAGMDDYVGTAVNYAKYVSQNASIVFAGFDYKNFGKSKGHRRGFLQDFSQLLDDCSKFINLICQRYSKIQKIFLSGFSMGGLISLELIRLFPQRFAGFIGLSPCVAYSPKQYYRTRIYKYLGLMFPNLILSNFRGSESVTIKYTSLNNSIQQNKHFINQGIILSKVSKIIKKVEQGGGLKKFQNITVPMLIIQSGSDKLIDPFGPLDLIEQIKSEDKQIVYLKQMWHYIWFSKEIKLSYPIISKWLTQRT